MQYVQAGNAKMLADTGYTIVARHGVTIPGSDDTAVPAILHGGEQVIPAPQARQMNGGGVTMIFNISLSSVGDQGLVKIIKEQALPMITEHVSQALTRQSRYGTWSIDSRAVRTVLI
jgi:hypothetical protein